MFRVIPVCSMEHYLVSFCFIEQDHYAVIVPTCSMIHFKLLRVK